MDEQIIGQRTPAQCRNGPIKDRQCHDIFCLAIYLILLSTVLFFIIFYAGGSKMTPEQIQQHLNKKRYGRPLLAIIDSVIPISLSLALTAAFGLIVMITTFVIPALVAYIYIPLSVLSMLMAGTIFILRYFGVYIPFVNQNFQQNFSHSKSSFTLIIGIAFIVGFFIATITVFVKRQKFLYIYYVLRIARVAFWSNWYIFVFSFLFTVLSVGALVGNVILLSICLTRKSHIIDPMLASILIIIETLWTHGILQAFSDFFFQSIAIHWYHKKRRIFMYQHEYCDSITITFRLIFTHIGTIAFGHLLAFIPEHLNIILGKLQKLNPVLYYIVCCFHNFTFRRLTKYCYFQTILQSLNFCQSNVEMFGLRRRTKAMLPKLYMVGNFYSSLVKIFSVIASMIFCYFLIANSHLVHVLTGAQKIWGPLSVTLLGTLQISNHFLNATGLVGDTLVFSYCADVEIQKKYFGVVEPYNCPDSIRDIIYQFKAGKSYVYDQ